MQDKITMTFEQAFRIATLLRRACVLSLGKGKLPITMEVNDLDVQIVVDNTQIT